MKISRLRLTLIALATLFLAASISPVTASGANDTKLIKFNGTLLKVHDDYLIVSGRKVVLLNKVVDGKKYVTEVSSGRKEPVNLKKLEKGTSLRILGQELPDKSVLALRIWVELE